ncbi:UNVERIFIED_CONTAM: hypothetical protein HDU68_005198 [Siphonaria sp. JEL0065]|nr:hypothetical protein HDU68_005198 [Siphonaria sp. JEL0065]
MTHSRLLTLLVLYFSLIYVVTAAGFDYDTTLDKERGFRIMQKENKRMLSNFQRDAQLNARKVAPIDAVPESGARETRVIGDTAEVTRYVSKQLKLMERKDKNYGMDGDESTRNNQEPAQTRKKRNFFDTSKPNFHSHQANNVFKPPAAAYLRNDIRHLRNVRGLAALREYSTSQLHDWFFWVFTGVWVVMGSAFVYAVIAVD